MSKEIFYFLAIFCIVPGVWLTKILIRGIKQRRNIHRIQQGIAEYCEAAARARDSFLLAETNAGSQD
jgi:hypothetical protein